MTGPVPMPRFCAYCHRIIDGDADEHSPDSASGAAPTVYFHPGCRSPQSWWSPAAMRRRDPWLRRHR
ncbi:hypothetical protein [Streptomyces thermolilacinus]|uniref:hypothetical protein n=1 Tax=Streptomyces thermolilacinus TaxID=285540 RepID=UPI0033D40675